MKQHNRLETPPIIRQIRVLSSDCTVEGICSAFVTNAFSEALLVSNFRKHEAPLLIRTESFHGPCSLIKRVSQGALLTTSWRLPSDFIICKDAEAIARLTSFCPLIHFLSFRDYCIAGGAASWAVRKCEDSRSDPPGDIDIFPIVQKGENDEIDQRLGDETLIRFLEEISCIYDAHYKETYSLHWCRSSSCTTIELVDRNLRGEHPMKIQFIHRLYESPAQIIGGFDFAASQVFFDGQAFYCSYIAMLSLHTGIMPLDFTRIGASWPYRLKKYSSSKGFEFLAPALNTKKLTEDPAPFQRSVCLSLHSREQFRVKMSFEFDQSGSKEEGPSFKQEWFRAYRHNEGDDDPSDIYARSVARANTRNAISGKPILVTAPTIEALVYDAQGSDTSYPWSVFQEAINKAKSTGKVDFALFEYLYGKVAGREAALYCYDKKWDELDRLTRRIVADFQKVMEEEFRKHRHLVWNRCNAKNKQYGAFNPHPLTEREFYGEHHNGFCFSPTFRQKLAFLWVLKNSHQTALPRLPREMVKKILETLDELVVKETLHNALVGPK